MQSLSRQLKELQKLFLLWAKMREKLNLLPIAAEQQSLDKEKDAMGPE